MVGIQLGDNMTTQNITYRLGVEHRKKCSFKQRVFAKLFAVCPFCSTFLMKKTKKVYGLPLSVAINKGFHCETAFLKVGEKTGLANLYIHGSGDVSIGDNVSISRDCKIITGGHDLHDFNVAIIKPTFIESDVIIFSGSNILQGVKIGRGAVIGAFSVVRTNIPPYAIVSGNPCKVIGFRYTPEEAFEIESKRYPENERISLIKLQKNFEKYYLSRIQEIRKFVSI